MGQGSQTTPAFFYVVWQDTTEKVEKTEGGKKYASIGRSACRLSGDGMTHGK